MVNPEDFLRSAENSYNRVFADQDHIELRNCISRAYYYIFHYSRKRFLHHPQARFSSTSRIKHHEEVVHFYHRINESTIANRVFSMRKARNKSDYDLHEHIKNRSLQIVT